jgi:hypothetical protein
MTSYPLLILLGAIKILCYALGNLSSEVLPSFGPLTLSFRWRPFGFTSRLLAIPTLARIYPRLPPRIGTRLGLSRTG